MCKPTSPCRECPYSPKGPRLVELLGTRNSDVRIYVGQHAAGFFFPCHLAPGYDADKVGGETLQCAGSAIMRANLGMVNPPGLLEFPAGPKAFGSYAAMVAHHLDLPVEESRALLRLLPPSVLAERERERAGVRFALVAREEQGATSCAPGA